MKRIWLQKIVELGKIIKNTNLSDKDRLTELFRKRELLETAFNRVEG